MDLEKLDLIKFNVPHKRPVGRPKIPEFKRRMVTELIKLGFNHFQIAQAMCVSTATIGKCKRESKEIHPLLGHS
jgi:hypothetical protein